MKNWPQQKYDFLAREKEFEHVFTTTHPEKKDEAPTNIGERQQKDSEELVRLEYLERRNKIYEEQIQIVSTRFINLLIEKEKDIIAIRLALLEAELKRRSHIDFIER